MRTTLLVWLSVLVSWFKSEAPTVPVGSVSESSVEPTPEVITPEVSNTVVPNVEDRTEPDTALRFEVETVENGWAWERLDYEIKIDTTGQVYFKIGSRWVAQPTVTAISFARE